MTTPPSAPIEPSDHRADYRALSESVSTLPLFSRAWWLDAVAGPDNWDVAVVRSQGQILAAMPYVIRHRLGMTLSDMPPLTQTLGPWLSPDHPSGRSGEKAGMFELIDQLPRIDVFRQNWHHSMQNWLPFHWRGFQQTTRYTYLLPELSNIPLAWTTLESRTRGDVRRASTRHGLRVEVSSDVCEIFDLCALTFGRQDSGVPFSLDVLNQIEACCSARGRSRVLIARDAEGRAHAGAYLVWDDQTTYYLVGGGDPDLRASGAGSLVVWEAITEAADRGHAFDFEGSMLEPVASFFRGFGAIQTPYHSVKRTRTRWQESALALRELWRR